MITHLGELNLTIDPKTGHARRQRETVEAQLEWNQHTDPFDSKLEGVRANYLYKLQLAGDVKQYVYHPFKITIARIYVKGKPKTMYYEPDFLTWWRDGRIVIEEIKGSLDQKNARDSITRFHVASGLLPMFQWQLVTRRRGQWEVKGQ